MSSDLSMKGKCECDYVFGIYYLLFVVNVSAKLNRKAMQNAPLASLNPLVPLSIFVFYYKLMFYSGSSLFSKINGKESYKLH